MSELDDTLPSYDTSEEMLEERKSRAGHSEAEEGMRDRGMEVYSNEEPETEVDDGSITVLPDTAEEQTLRKPLWQSEKLFISRTQLAQQLIDEGVRNATVVASAIIDKRQYQVTYNVLLEDAIQRGK